MSHLHLPDGIFPYWLWLGAYALVAVIVGLLLWRDRKVVDTRRFSLLGIFAALMLLAMSIEIPPFPYHVNLSIVTAIVLGPGLAVLAAALVNLMLAFLGHGGITVVGINTLILAVEMLAGYGLFHLFRRFRLSVKIAGFLAVFLGLAISTGVSYTVTAASAPWINRTLQTAEQTHVGEAHEEAPVEQASKGGHLDLRRLAYIVFGLGFIGWIIEALISTGILSVLYRSYPELVEKKNE